jgi:spore germination cell wall hydrolase CwlJ-like protein
MWLNRINHLSGAQRLIMILGALAASLGLAWHLGAWASPTGMPHAKLQHRPTRAADATFAAVTPVAVPPQIFETLSPDQAAQDNAKTPFSGLPNPAARPFKLITTDPNDRARAQTCLAMAVYYEAANQGPDGEAAVAQVVLNRLRNPLFPKTVCGVVFEGSSLPTGCQFTFTCDGSLGRPPNQAGWKQASEVAERALNGYVHKAVGDATHYHTVWVVPYWRSSLVKLTQIGAHIFYRWPGGLGLPGAFTGQYAGSENAPPPIKGFDTGASQTQLATLDDKVLAPAAPPLSAVSIVAPAKPVQVAMLTSDTSAVLMGPIEPPAPERPRGFFGRSGGSDQHLPMPTR